MTSAEGPKVKISASEAPMEVEDIEFGDTDDYGDEMGGLPSDDEEDEEEFQIEEDQEAAPLKMQILPLYSLLPTREQLRVFESCAGRHASGYPSHQRCRNQFDHPGNEIRLRLWPVQGATI
ncbi:putative ATP-dependent RNA helicase DHR1 [Metarhizium acridum]|uniref:putative ATP-dependent RNA helicase DHR1 n=1 Tax=Metarhizium acridum TaxID=92637 RepID=UPI001C6B41B9|nr:putative ATP-dependent RNA helicase DHR1 [Metarhizium acridum]